MDAPTIRLSRLHHALAQPFGAARVASVARKLREAGIIPAGRSGFGGAHSARLSPQHVALILLALSSGANPADCPAAAKRLGGFKLVAISGPRGRRPVHETAAALRLIDVMAGALSNAAERSIPVPASWTISEHEALMLGAETAIFAPDPPGAPSLRSTALPSDLIRAVATLFERPPERQKAPVFSSLPPAAARL